MTSDGSRLLLAQGFRRVEWSVLEKDSGTVHGFRWQTPLIPATMNTQSNLRVLNLTGVCMHGLIDRLISTGLFHQLQELNVSHADLRSTDMVDMQPGLLSATALTKLLMHGNDFGLKGLRRLVRCLPLPPPCSQSGGSPPAKAAGPGLLFLETLSISGSRTALEKVASSLAASLSRLPHLTQVCAHAKPVTVSTPLFQNKCM